MGVALVLALLAVSAYVYFWYYIPLGPSRSVDIPWIVQVSPFGVPNGEQIPTGNYPINKSEATQYATTLLKDYDNLVDANQALYLSPPSLRRFFPLYQSFQVYVARENWTKGPERIEFLFVTSPSATSPKVTIFTNETAQYLRPDEVVGVNVPTENTYSDYIAANGYYMGDLTTQSPIGVGHFDAVWVTNSSSVYNDTLLNSNTAAHTIYDANAKDYNYKTNPPALSPLWLRRFAVSLPGVVLEVVCALAAIFTLQAEVRRAKRSKNPRIRRPRQSESSSEHEDKGENNR